MWKTHNVRRVPLFAGILIGVASLCALLMSTIYAGPAVQVYGTVQNEQGQAVEDVSVYATQPGMSQTYYGPVTTDSAGQYSLPVGYQATYDIHFVPPSGGTLESYVEQQFSVTTVNRQLDAVMPEIHIHTFSGTVLDAASAPVDGLGLQLTDANGNSEMTYTDENGAFSATRTGGVYSVRLIKDNDGIALAYPYFDLPQSDVDLSSSDVTRQYQLPAVISATVTLRDRTGALAVEQPVNYAVESTQSYSTTTDSQGVAVLPMLQDVTIPEGAVCATVTTLGGGMVCNSLAYDGTTNISMELYAPELYMLTGTITDAADGGVEGLTVRLISQTTGIIYEAGTDATGAYAITAEPDSYEVVLTDMDVISLIPTWGTFALSQGVVNLTSADAVGNYELPEVYQLHVTVVGNAVNSFKIRVGSSESTPYYHASAGGSASASLPVLAGEIIPVGSLCVVYTGLQLPKVCNTTEITITDSDQSYEFVAPGQ